MSIPFRKCIQTLYLSPKPHLPAMLYCYTQTTDIQKVKPLILPLINSKNKKGSLACYPNLVAQQQLVLYSAPTFRAASNCHSLVWLSALHTFFTVLHFLSYIWQSSFLANTQSQMSKANQIYWVISIINIANMSSQNSQMLP